MTSTSTIPRFVLLSALWGASYVFIRVGAAQFGALPLAGVRALVAALALLPVLVRRHDLDLLKAHWKMIALVGMSNCAAPYVLFAVAERHIPAGMSSIFTAATPVYSAVIAWVWLREQPTLARIIGLALGLGGVILLVHSRQTGDGASGAGFWSAMACIAATVSYAVSGNLTRRFLAHVPPLSIATGCQLAAAVVLMPAAAFTWPEQMPSSAAWASLAALAIFSTALAYILFFQLIRELGPAGASAPLFLIPPFGLLWGWLLLDEPISAGMVGSVAVILLGTALAVGYPMFKLRLSQPVASGNRDE